ncbi:hypothetical protein EVAR_90562_1 [Eumeta japonica]|uniref:Uncharacterized protein n=1 Tax=Eumeta variegata TaxID=151549 RepID=A0A4C1YV57_EUMVA|nr:hypothetical protein EVAR_90562_1 [Eumeta japonica]
MQPQVHQSARGQRPDARLQRFSGNLHLLTGEEASAQTEAELRVGNKSDEAGLERNEREVSSARARSVSAAFFCI